MFMGPLLDLELEWTRFVYGDVTVILSWTLDDRRPAMVLVPSWRRRGRRITPCVVKIDNAHLWDEHTGDPAETARMSAEFARALGLPEHPAYALRVLSVVRECLGELLKMPPAPDNLRRPVADVRAVDAESGRVLHEGEVLDDV